MNERTRPTQSDTKNVRIRVVTPHAYCAISKQLAASYKPAQLYRILVDKGLLYYNHDVLRSPRRVTVMPIPWLPASYVDYYFMKPKALPLPDWGGGGCCIIGKEGVGATPMPAKGSSLFVTLPKASF